jgi:hypothetical protein
VQGTARRAPKQNATNVAIPTTLEWDAVDKATTYEFMLFTDHMLTEVLSVHTSDTSITIDTLGYNRDYLARVRPKNVTSAGPWRSVEFTTVDNGSITTSNEGNGTCDRTGAGAIPTAYEWQQNYPNPFNPTTVTRYALRQATPLCLKVYDMMGRKEGTVVSGTSTGWLPRGRVFDAAHPREWGDMYLTHGSGSIPRRGRCSCLICVV